MSCGLRAHQGQAKKRRGGACFVLLFCLGLLGCTRATGRPTAISPLSLLPVAPPTPSVRPPDCRGLAPAASSLPTPSLPVHVWSSAQVVVGTVLSQEARWEVSSGYPYIVTYSLVRVEERVRGQPADVLIIGTNGGSLDGCKQGTSGATLQSNARYLLFLNHDQTRPEADARQSYRINGGAAGRQLLTADADLVALLDPLRQILAQVPPRDFGPYSLVPLERAPIGTPPTRP